MRCSYKPQANALWSMLYCLLTLLITSYQIYLGVRRYFIFNEYDWPHRSHANIYSIISVSLHGLALVLVPFFIAASCFKVGNLASDGECLGERTKKVVDVLVGTPLCRKLKSAWQHGPPVAQTIHLCLAFALLIAHTLMETQFFKHYHGSPVLETEEIWTTDLEFLYNIQDDKVSQLIRDGGRGRPLDMTRHRLPRSYQLSEYDGGLQLDADPYMESSEKTVSALDIGPRLLPLLSSFRLYGISLAFFNYVLALFAYTAVYPSVFWRASKPFSAIFCCHLLLHAVTAIFAFIGFVILYRFQVSGGARPPFILNQYLLVSIYVASCAILFFASSVVYGYGYNKFCLRLLTTAGNGRGRLSRFRGTKTYPVCCEGYCPHIAAILMLILMVAAKAPVLYDQMILYQKHLKSITMVCIVVDVAYLFAWILLWLALTLKREWAFKVRYSNSEIGALLGVHTEEGRPVTESTLMVICRNDCFATDDESKRIALLQLAEKCGLGQHTEEVYWLKPSHACVSGNGDTKQASTAPEMNTLLGGSGNTTRPVYHQQQQQAHYHSKSATIGVSGGNYYKKYTGPSGGNSSAFGYSKVSFSDCEPDGTPRLQKRQLEQRFAPIRASGSYVRFNDDQSTTGINYDDHATQDIVSTFGTLPRQDYPRRRIVHANGKDIFAPPPPRPQQGPVQTVANVGPLRRTPSPMRQAAQLETRVQPDNNDQPQAGFITYASVHKRSGSPVARAAEYGRMQQLQQHQHQVSSNAVNSENVSRGSSYANIPNSGAGLAMADAVRPPSGRVAVQPQQYHHHQHHYNAASTDSSPSFYTTMPPAATDTPQTSQNRRHHTHYRPVNGPDTMAMPPKNSPNLELDYHGQGRKLTSFSNSSSASGGVGGVESGETTPTQQTYGITGGTMMGNTLTASASSSSREMTPLSNASGTLTRPMVGMKSGSVPPHQTAAGAWRLNSVYGQTGATVGPSSRSQTPQGSNYSGTATPTPLGSTMGLAGVNHVHQQHGTGLSVVYFDNGQRGVRSTVGQHTGNGKGMLGLESNDRNDSANFSLTSSNESDNNQFVTSIV